MSELKPCPYCGSGDVHIFGINKTCYVMCYDCFMKGPRIKGKKNTIAAWNSLPRHLRWTKEQPTKTGWYWYRDKHRPRQVVYVFYGDEDRCMFVQFLEPHETPWNLSNLSGEWSEIQEPVE